MTTDSPMTLGVVGLGRMGAQHRRRLMADGHSTVVHDINPAAVADPGRRGGDRCRVAREPRGGAAGPASRLGHGSRRPDHGVDHRRVADVLAAGDTIIDGGNTHYTDDLRPGRPLGELGIHHIDCGTSGGVWGPSAATA